MNRRALCSFVACLAVSHAASAQVAAGSATPPPLVGVEGKYAAASADRAQLEILARLPNGTTAADLEITGLSQYSAVVASVSPARQLSSHTVFAIDGTKSFLPHIQEAVEVISAWATDSAVTLDATHTAQFVLLGDKVVPEVGPVETSATGFSRRLEAFLSRGAVGTTMLLTGLDQAIKVAEHSGPHDLRSVWLFTDGDDDSKAVTEESARTLASRAAASRVRLFTATTEGKLHSSAYLTHLGTIKSITGGSGILLGRPPGVAARQLHSVLEAETKLSLVRAPLCGLPQGAGELSVALTHLPSKSGSTTLVTHESAWAPAVHQSCCSAAQCSGWRACAGNACEPKSCSADADCGGDAFCEQGKCTDQKPTASMTGKGGNGVWYALAALLALGALVAVGLARSRGRPGPSKAELDAKRAEALRASAEERAAAKPPVAVAPLAPVAAVALEELPETHLVVQLGPPDTQGKRFRLARRVTRVGTAEGNQVRFDIASVSGEHAEFQLYPTGALFVRDLDSTNGVTVDGQRLPRGGRVELKPGAQISLGSSLRLEVTRPGIAPVERSPERVAPPRKPEAAEASPAKKSTVFDRN